MNETWVTKEQLDTPLCDIFANVKTNGTARIYAQFSERILGLEHKNLEEMKCAEMNEYIDWLAVCVDKKRKERMAIK